MDDRIKLNFQFSCTLKTWFSHLGAWPDSIGAWSSGCMEPHRVPHPCLCSLITTLTHATESLLPFLINQSPKCLLICVQEIPRSKVIINQIPWCDFRLQVVLRLGKGWYILHSPLWIFKYQIHQLCTCRSSSPFATCCLASFLLVFCFPYLIPSCWHLSLKLCSL
jgi:hypothetical protein